MHRHAGHRHADPEEPAGEGDARRPSGCAAPAGEIVARAEAACGERGVQFTPLRREVLEAVAAAEAPRGAYDIAEALSRPGRRVAPVSVYRALDVLMELGLVHRIASRNAFVPCAHAHGPGEGVVFLICRTCGGVDETAAPEVEVGLDRALERAGFKPASRILEVEGDCGACRDKARAG